LEVTCESGFGSCQRQNPNVVQVRSTPQPYQSDVVEPGAGQSTVSSRALHLPCVLPLSVMSKQPRRTARTTRSTKDSENANARPSSRLITRTKPTSTTTAPTKTSSTVATRAKTVLTDAKPDATAPAKRKRAALGEIAGPSNQNQKEKPASKRTTKDKPKEKFDGVVLKKSTVTTTTTTSTIRQPLKAVTGGAPQSRKAVISVSEQVQQLEQIQEDIPAGGDPMAIDPPHRVKAEILETKSLRVVSSRKQLKAVDEVDEEESRRVVKKRRTSSDLPEEAQIAAHIPPEEVEDLVAHPKRSTTPEAEPDGDQWDDLDAEDADDPLMVSEYVTEIFAYLKEVEVSESSVVTTLSLMPNLPEKDYAQPQLYGDAERSRLEDAGDID